MLQNFAQLSGAQQVVLSLLIRTPVVKGNYSVQVYTWNTVYGAQIDTGSVVVAINDTFGVSKLFVVHPLRSTAKVLAGDSGPLELTFFLNYVLPRTNATTSGKITVGNIYMKNVDV